MLVTKISACVAHVVSTVCRVKGNQVTWHMALTCIADGLRSVRVGQEAVIKIFPILKANPCLHISRTIIAEGVLQDASSALPT